MGKKLIFYLPLKNRTYQCTKDISVYYLYTVEVSTVNKTPCAKKIQNKNKQTNCVQWSVHCVQWSVQCQDLFLPIYISTYTYELFYASSCHFDIFKHVKYE